MANLKYSRQREAIKSFLSTRKDHPTADTIYIGLRKEFPNISLGTVYRNLSLLTSLGEIQQISAGSGAEHFDYISTPHSHFVCKKCQRVMDLETENLDHIMDSAQKNFDGQIEKYSATFYGICADCIEKS